MEVRVVAAGNGWQWIADGFAMFRRAPVTWLALTFLLGLLWLASLLIPLLGPLLFNLFSPMLFAGLMVGCRALDNGQPLEPGHLFAGYRHQPASLVTVGGVYLVGTIVVVGIVVVTAGDGALRTVMSRGADLEAVRAALRSLTTAFIVGAAAYLPVVMAIWFAPALIVFDRLPPVPAMKLSFTAWLRNLLAFVVYLLGVIGLWIAISFAAVFGTLGVVLMTGLLIASVPVLICSVYMSYKDVFPAARAAAAGGSASVG